VFIGFGGTEAETVAVELWKFLSAGYGEIIDPFCASQQANSIPPNTPQYHARINQELDKCDIAVFVCHRDTPKSGPIKAEVNLLYEKRKENRIITFAASDDCLPKKLRERHWHPLHFPPEKAEESFPRLLNNIYGSFILLTPKPTGIIHENERMVRQ
jgi:hypothetical protein